MCIDSGPKNITKQKKLNNISYTNKKAPLGTFDEINDEAVKKVGDNGTKKVPKIDKIPAFITFEDHKTKFPKEDKYRLLNPSR